MNGFDFDNTIYKGDSTFHFYFYLLRKSPSVLLSLPYQGYSFLLYSLKIIDKTRFKQRFYSCFKRVKNIDMLVESFWQTHFCNIKQFYLDIKQSDDVIISASPEFLLEIPCKRLAVGRLIASRVDKSTGKYTGLNCWGEEKVLRFKEIYGDITLGSFYSDSLSDTPMAKLAQKSFIVRDDEIIDWQEYSRRKK